MDNEYFAGIYIQSGSIHDFLGWIRCIKNKGCYALAAFLCKRVYALYSNNLHFLDEMGMCCYYSGQHYESWQVYERIFAFRRLSEQQQKNYFFNAHFNIPHLNTLYVEKPERPLQLNPLPLITFSITTCKRYDLFTKTMNSFLHCCEDVNLIHRWLCVDDNSSEEDRQKMKENYPFMEFYFKSKEEKGHAQSMNIILNKTTTPYLWHMEDDWYFYHRRPMLTQCLEVLQTSTIPLGQCLANKNYAEISQDINILGGIYNETPFGLGYYIHDHKRDVEEFYAIYGHGQNSAYWPHYSLRPGLNNMAVLKEVGTYNASAPHFEMEYAQRYMEKGYHTAFLVALTCTHTGRLTKERDDKSKLNAYDLNNEAQFTGKRKRINDMYEIYVINMDNRKDRWQEFQKQEIEAHRFTAVDGYKLKATRALEQLFNACDYNFRRGMIGCALSHISLWIQLLASNEELYVVLEDDVTLVPYFQLKLKSLVKQLEGKPWDVLFLGHHTYPRYCTPDTHDLYKIPSCEQWTTRCSLQQSMGGTGGYIVTRLGAERLLHFIQEQGMVHGIDTMMQKACDTLSIYYCTPHLFSSQVYTPNSLEIDTDIQRNYDSLRRPFSKRLEEELEFYANQQVQVIECSKETPLQHDMYPQHVIMCHNQCSKKYTYAIESVRIHVPSTVDTVQAVALKDKNGNYSVSEMIIYESD